MRRIRLLTAAAVLVLGVLSFAGASGAQTESTAKSEDPALTEEAKCVLEASESGKTGEELNKAVEDCAKAQNPLLPEKNEIIWGALAFIIVLIFLWKYGVPAIKQGMQARSDRIREDLEKAESQREEAETVLSEYRAQLADAKTEGSRIIEEARQTADAMKADLAASAQADIAAMRQKATADIEAAKVQAIADLRGEVANIAIGAAERVVERSLDRETSTQLVESFINQVGSNS